MKPQRKLREIWRRLGFYFRRERFDRELDDEMRFHLALNGYKGERLASFYRQVSERVETIPGVKSATVSMYPFLRGGGWGMGTPNAPGNKKIVDRNINFPVLAVRNNFFRTLQIPLLFGREFDTRDNQNSPKVAIVNQSFVKLVFDDDIPIGQHFQFERSNGSPIFEVVGVVRDSIYEDLHSAPDPIVYFAFEQQLAAIDRFGEGMTYEVRSAGDPSALVPAIREVVRSIDSKIPVDKVKTQSQQIDELLSGERIFDNLTSALGVLV